MACDLRLVFADEASLTFCTDEEPEENSFL
jgi:hypothetical protein